MLTRALSLTYRAIIRHFEADNCLAQWKDVVRYTVGRGLRPRYNPGI